MPKRSIAIHEAGHAAAHIAHRRRFRYVTIVETRELLGHVRIKPPRYGAPLSESLDYCVSSLAGYCAERHFGFRPWRERWADDLRLATDRAAALSMSPEEASLWLRLAMLRARSLVAMWEPVIAALADELQAKGTLTFREAEQIARSAMSATPAAR